MDNWATGKKSLLCIGLEVTIDSLAAEGLFRPGVKRSRCVRLL